MLAFNVLSVLALSALASGIVIVNNQTNTVTCSPEGGNFCDGASLSSNIIYRCTGTVAQPGNCNDNLAGVPPVGVKTGALCYQSSLTAGDAQCSYLGNIFPNGVAVPIPGGDGSTSSSSTSSSSSSSSSSSTSSSSTSSSSTSSDLSTTTSYTNQTTTTSTTDVSASTTVVATTTTATDTGSVTTATDTGSATTATETTTAPGTGTAAPLPGATTTTTAPGSAAPPPGSTTKPASASNPPSGTSTTTVKPFTGAAAVNKVGGGFMGVAFGMVVAAFL